MKRNNLRKHKIKYQFAAVFAFTVMLAVCFAKPAAYAFSKDNMDITFSLPAEESLIELPAYIDDDNVFAYSDTSYNSVMVVMSDIYYKLNADFPNLTQQKIEKRYPKDQLWIGCGLFDDKWNDEDFIYNYLKESVDSKTTQYSCTLDTIEVKGLPVYKFTYLSTEGDANSSGGTIYFKLYKSKTYLVDISNFFNHSATGAYLEAFESSLDFKGLDTFAFKKYVDTSAVLIICLVFAVIIITAGVLYYIYRSKREKNDIYKQYR
jgi:hypothetical protein